jgi:hypothetical protein
MHVSQSAADQNVQVEAIHPLRIESHFGLVLIHRFADICGTLFLF